jgi:branched-chain amino acid transport system permease protein
MPLSEWILQLGIGLSFGLLLFLLASGFTLTFGLARFVNLAHGAVFLVAAYTATAIAQVSGAGFWLALGAAALTGVVLSMAIYAVARLRWSRIGHDDLAQVLLTFGILLVVAEGAQVLWDGLPRSADPPGFLAGSWAIGDAAFPVYRVFMAGAALLLAGALWWLQNRTTFGALVRAGVDDPEMLEATATPAGPLFAAVFALSGLLAGLAGGLGAPVIGAGMGQEFTILVFAFVIVVIGGPGSLLGAFVASLAVGLADAFGKALIPTFAEFTMMALVVLVLAWRPHGLFGWAER